MYPEEINNLQQRLRAQADLDVKAWWENYVKGSAPFLGVKMPVIRATVHSWHRGLVALRLDLAQQLDLALALFDGIHTEEKLAGTLYLQEILLYAGAVSCRAHLDRLAGLFTTGNIADWNICDWFCVKVLGPLIEREGWSCAQEISAWREAENLWQARASLVAFANLAENTAYYPLLEKSCLVLIRREERFAKTAVGWILREASKTDRRFTIRLIEANLTNFSLESLKNALKYFPKETKAQFVRRLQGVQA